MGLKTTVLKQVSGQPGLHRENLSKIRPVSSFGFGMYKCVLEVALVGVLRGLGIAYFP